MANQKLFVSSADAFAVKPLQVGNSMSTTYTYDGSILRIFWKGNEVTTKTGVKDGDAFIIKCGGTAPTICKLKVPHRNDDLLMWLLSYDKESRAYNEGDYQRLLSQQRKEYGWRGYRDWEVSGKNYSFTLCNHSDCGGVYHIAAYVKNADKKMAKEIIQKWERGIYWPKSFVKSLLKKRFGFTDAELEELRAFQDYNLPLAE